MNISNNLKLIIIFVSSLLLFILGVIVTGATEIYANIWLGVVYFAIWITLSAFIYQNIIKEYFRAKKQSIPSIPMDDYTSPIDETYKDLPLRERVSRYVDERRGMKGIKETHLRTDAYPPRNKTDTIPVSSFYNEPGLPDIVDGSIENIPLSTDFVGDHEIELLDLEKPEDETQSFMQESDIDDLPMLTDVEYLDESLVIPSENDDNYPIEPVDDEHDTDISSSDEQDLTTVEIIDLPGFPGDNDESFMYSMNEDDDLKLSEFNQLSIEDAHDPDELIEDFLEPDLDDQYGNELTDMTSEEDGDERVPDSPENDTRKKKSKDISLNQDLPNIEGELDSELDPDAFFSDEELDDINLDEDPVG